MQNRWMQKLILGLALAALPAVSQAGIFISVRFGPPALPVYVQPVCPGDGYIWTPGYWAYSDLSGYYWVPGTWVLAPQPGYLWTPPYWGFANGVYGFHPGYWGLHVGFYGGVNYGFGYGGVGFEGGFWERGVFRYNTAVSNVNVTVIHNTYNRTVINNNLSRVSYNGGPGGLSARPSPQEVRAERERYLDPTPIQSQHEQEAMANHSQWASVNHGRPAFAATARPGEFNRSTAHGSNAAAAYQPQTQTHGTQQTRGTPQAHTPVPQRSQAAAQVHHQPQPQAQAQSHQQQAPAHQQAARPQTSKGERPERK